MMKKKLVVMIVGLALLSAEGLAASAIAGDLRVRCERRGNKRSKISVDGNNVRGGNYNVMVTSGGNTVQASAATVGDEFETDFDSNRADIRAGATAISATFIQGGTVNVSVTGPESLSATNVACRIR
ncbi:MAG TPA: hypothetical protein VFK65_17845 [Candidatus Binatia bacterium]|nr:hypothetical protein [Candidatus Binatia bacterium]